MLLQMKEILTADLHFKATELSAANKNRAFDLAALTGVTEGEMVEVTSGPSKSLD